MSRTRITFPTPLVGIKASKPAAKRATDVATDLTPIVDVLSERIERATQQHEALMEVLQTVGTTIEQVKGTVEQRLDEMTNYIVELAFGLASRVLRNEIDLGRYNPAPAVLDALHSAVQSVTECIDRLEEFSAPELKRPEVRFEVDVSIPVGACRIETSVGRILLDPETTLETMMGKIREELEP